MHEKLSSIALALLAITAVQTADAAPACSNQDLAGAYGMSATGAILVAPGFPAELIGPFARVGRVVFDGKGNLSVANVASYNGNIIPETYGGTYTVSSSCILNVTVLVGLPLGPGGALVPVPFQLVGALANGGNSAAMLACGLGPGVPCAYPQASPPGNVIRVLINRQSSNVQSTCTTQSLFGTFLLDMSGMVITTSGGPVAGPFARDGVLVFDGKGGFSTNAVANYSGYMVDAENQNGTYTLDALCNLTITYGPTATPQTWTGTLTNQSYGANVIVNQTGTVISGTLKASNPITIMITGPFGAISATNNFLVTSAQVGLNASQSASINVGGLSYSWQPVPGFPSLSIPGGNTATPFLQLTQPGTYEVILTVTDSTGATATATVTLEYI
jgi:hypothetical protein